MSIIKFIKRIKRNRKRKYIIKRYKEVLSSGDVQYPFLRYQIADAKCLEAVGKGQAGFYDLIKWQDIRSRYFDTLVKLRPRNNEFFSY